MGGNKISALGVSRSGSKAIDVEERRGGGEKSESQWIQCSVPVAWTKKLMRMKQVKAKWSEQNFIEFSFAIIVLSK